MAIAGEVGELVEIFQWLSEEQASSLSEYDRARVAEELADIQIYLLQISDELDISLADSVDSKIASNALRYPVEKFKGIAKKAPRSGDG
jgi:NTP pyrophosphatase (non-canonical NTP hydrolase)